MKTDQGSKQQVSDAVTKFLTDQMSITPTAVSIDIHADSLVVTFREGTSLVERDCAGDGQVRERLERCYAELFAVSKPMLEAAMTNIIGHGIERSRLSVDVMSGDGVVLFFFHP